MAKRTDPKSKRPAVTVTTSKQPLERGINLDVPGRALIAQAGERIKWHKRSADVLAAELKSLSMKVTAAGTIENWEVKRRRSDADAKMNGHLEYARFLAFVRKHIVARRIYRLGLADMSHLEIMPKGSYL